MTKPLTSEERFFLMYHKVVYPHMIDLLSPTDLRWLIEKFVEKRLKNG